MGYLEWLDICIIVAYFVAILSVGLLATYYANKNSSLGFFLAGKSMTFIPLAGSIFASNMGAPNVVGLSGSAAASGFAPVMFEWQVKNVQRTLNEASEIKERERNLVIFNLPEKENQNDRELVMKIFKHISKDMSDNGIEKVFRLGKKNESVIRPVLIKLDSLGTKWDLLKHAFKIRSLEDNLKNIRLCNDLTREQRSELKNLVTDAKAKEAACQQGFLYRVREMVGRWKIIKFMKGTEN
ncbi:hypothetical protein HELRODRAFT_174006 [Helobdella robusta]|uniref:Uncharacterized protein n=1 Tax=Helobdella robusta TaxID=6412 RepID=T1F7H0_HELRO|nr:hypothetical protein HELRODRAFT_174006 [Helobdella robusta]ESO03118.1 hypothetical protein HELRODRAFT_174006 [Helobdella robusta]